MLKYLGRGWLAAFHTLIVSALGRVLQGNALLALPRKAAYFRIAVRDSTNPMKVLAIVQCWNSRDLARGFIVDWMECLADRVDKLTIVTLEQREESSHPKIQIYSLGKERGNKSFPRILYLIKWLSLFVRLFLSQKARPDVVFTHMTPLYSILAFPFTAPFRIPIFTWYSHPENRLIHRAAYRVSENVCTASPEVQKAAGQKALLNRNAVDTKRFKSTEQETLNQYHSNDVVMVGRIDPIKQAHLVIEACDLCRRDGVHFNLKLVGDCTPGNEAYLQGLKDLVHRLNLSDRVFFLGTLPHRKLPELYRHARAYVNPMKVGGFGKAVLEAMAAGIPTIIGTDAFNEELGKWKGALVTNGQTPQAIANSLQNVLALDRHSYFELSSFLQTLAHGHSLDLLFDTLVDRFHATRRTP